MTAALLFLRRYWFALLTAVGLCLVVFAAYANGVNVGEAAIKAQWQADIAERTQAQAAEKLKLETAYEERYKTAMAARDAQMQQVQAAADSARAAVGGLRQQIAQDRGRLAQASRAALTEYAHAAADVFAECAAAYQHVAEKADAHALDAQALLQAWPVQGDQ